MQATSHSRLLHQSRVLSPWLLGTVVQSSTWSYFLLPPTSHGDSVAEAREVVFDCPGLRHQSFEGFLVALFDGIAHLLPVPVHRYEVRHQESHAHEAGSHHWRVLHLRICFNHLGVDRSDLFTAELLARKVDGLSDKVGLGETGRHCHPQVPAAHVPHLHRGVVCQARDAGLRRSAILFVHKVVHERNQAEHCPLQRRPALQGGFDVFLHLEIRHRVLGALMAAGDRAHNHVLYSSTGLQEIKHAVCRGELLTAAAALREHGRLLVRHEKDMRGLRLGDRGLQGGVRARVLHIADHELHTLLLELLGGWGCGAASHGIDSGCTAEGGQDLTDDSTTLLAGSAEDEDPFRHVPERTLKIASTAGLCLLWYIMGSFAPTRISGTGSVAT